MLDSMGGLKIYFRAMFFKYIGRWVFVVAVLGVMVFCWWNFRSYLRTSSDPFTLLPQQVKWVWVIHDWQGVMDMQQQDSDIPFLKKHIGEVEVWSEWATQYPDILLLLNQRCMLWVSQDSMMSTGFWCFGLPDNWSSSRVDQLCKQVPHLIRKGDGLIWSIDGEHLDKDSFLSEEELEKWKTDYQTIDHSSSLAVLGENSICRFALENRKGDWWGYISASQDVLGSEPLDTLLSLKTGDWCGAAYMKNLPNQQGDTALKNLSQSFAVDTACQCNAWEEMWKWQPLIGSVHIGNNEGVVLSQSFTKNPLTLFRKLFSDTTSRLMRIQDQTFVQGSLYQQLGCDWKWASKRRNLFLTSNDSLSMVAFISDTSEFRDLRFEHSFPNHPVLLGYHRNAVESKLMPINWTLIKGDVFSSIQVYLAGDNRWVVQLNKMNKPK
jgi:hypothetical protein